MLTRVVLLLFPLLAAAAPLPLQFSNLDTPEGWIWQQVQAGKPADLNNRCKTEPLDIKKRDDERWKASCRRVSPDLLRELLIQPDLADLAPRGVVINGAYIDGRLDLSEANIRTAFLLNSSWITGDADLADARLNSHLGIRNTLIAGEFRSERMSIDRTLSMDHVVFDGLVDLTDAHVDSRMSMDGASIGNKKLFIAERLHVGADLYLHDVKFGGRVDLIGAHVDGGMSMDGASTADNQLFDAERLHVGAGLFMRYVKFGGPVDLTDAHVDGEVGMDGATTADNQQFKAERLHAGVSGLFMRNVKFGGPVDLINAHADGQMALDNSSIADKQPFNAARLHVGADLFIRNVKFGGEANFLLLVVDGGVDLRNSHMQRLNLTEAAVRDDLAIGGAEEWLHWDACDDTAPCFLDLSNAKVGNLQDDGQAWPARITLEGFTYAHLGGIGGYQRQDMRNRPIQWWSNWLSRDPIYSAQPYTQLAGVLAAAGNRDGSADVRFFGRDRQRQELLRECTRQKLGSLERPDGRPCGLAQWGAGFCLTGIQWFVGYGIGDYIFRAVKSALGLALIGTAILCFAPGVRGVRPSCFLARALWCFGASLQKVFPLIAISPEFSDFFNDPKRERLRIGQHIAFGLLTVCGWVLAELVAAAFSGLIQT